MTLTDTLYSAGPVQLEYKEGVRPSHRKALLFTVFGGVVAFVVLGPERNRSSGHHVSQAAPPAQPRGAARAPGSKGETRSVSLVLPERPALGEPSGTLFGAQSWQPPPPPKAAPRPAQPPIPPLPYGYAGRVVHGENVQVFLSKGGRAIPIKEGDVLDGTYRVESIATDRITLVYLPLDHRETIAARAPPQ